MNPPDDSQSGKQLEVARIGGGPSARLGALVVGVVLVVVIGVAIAGRPPAPPAVSATPPAVAAGETPAPTAVPTEEPTAAPTPGRPAVFELYGASLLIGTVRYEMILDSIGTSRLSTDIRVPLPRSEANGVLSFNALSSFGSAATVKSISEWSISLAPLTKAARDRIIVLEVDVPARPKLLNVPPPIRRGYHLIVYARSDLLFGVVTMEVTLGPRPGITGDDGLIGWPTGPK